MSKQITPDEVLKLAKLAHLTLTEDEVSLFQQQLSQTLDYVNILDELGTQNVRPLDHPTDESNIFRNDISNPSLSAQEALSGSQDTYKNMFKINAILKEQ